MTLSRRENQRSKQVLKDVIWFLVIARWTLHLTSAAAPPCNKVFNVDGSRRIYSNCSYVETKEDVVAIAWSHQPGNFTLEVAFSGQLLSYGGWIGWGINPNCSIMAETSALVAYRAPNGSNILPYKLGHSLYKNPPPKLKCSAIDVEVVHRGVTITDFNVTMFISMKLKPNQTTVNQIWGKGTTVETFVPTGPCNPDTHNVATLDVYKGILDLGVRRKCPVTNRKLKKVHVILTALGYGVLYPVATLMSMIAFFKKSVAFLYILLLGISYASGTVGFQLGLTLHDRHVPRDDITPGQLKIHRNLGIAIVSLSSFQVLITIVRLLRLAEKNRRAGSSDMAESEAKQIYLCLVNLFIGYALTVIIFINVLQGFQFMDIEKRWRTLYYVVAFISFACSMWEAYPQETSHGSTNNSGSHASVQIYNN